MKRYKITCKSCGGYDHLLIDDNHQVMYTKHTPIIAARWRPDMNFGFECTCGNDSRLAPQEKDQANILVSGASKMTIKQMVKHLEPKPNTRFSMEPA